MLPSLASTRPDSPSQHRDHPAVLGPAMSPLRRQNATMSDDVEAPPNASPHDFAQFLLATHNGSPISRAGLLQPQSFISTVSRASRPRLPVSPHTADDIRDYTMQLSRKPAPRSIMSSPNVSQDAFIFPTSALQSPVLDDSNHPHNFSHHPLSASVSSAILAGSVSDLSASTSTLGTERGGGGGSGSGAQRGHDFTHASAPGSGGATKTPRGRGRSGRFQPSGISLLRSRQGGESSSSASDESHMPTPTLKPRELPLDPSLPSSTTSKTVAKTPPLPPPPQHHPRFDAHPSHRREEDEEDSILDSPSMHERRPLLADVESGNLRYHSVDPSSNDHGHTRQSSKSTLQRWSNSVGHRLHSLPRVDSMSHFASDVVHAIPAATLGTLLNVLDGISYGMIIFPAAGVFSGLGGVGVSMFFVSTVVSQLLYSAGLSGFAGANGSMMIEVVPFFHILAQSISAYIGEDKPHEILATTVVAFALSSVLTGVSFMLLGALRLGSLIGFFPRHILVGCIGGVGVFLIITGLTVCTRITEDDFDLSLETFKFFFLDGYNIALWLPPFALAVILRIITHRYHHQLIFPLYFIFIPAVFYFVVVIARLDTHVLRQAGWLFDMDTSDDPWYKFYTLFDFKATDWGALWATLPTQFALLFFNILHPPLNVPALAVSLDHDVDTDKELVAHGYSNLVAGALGTVPNYLVYVNTLLFYRVGGDTRISGFLLAGATTLLLFIGTGPIAYIPVMVVGALIFVLGIDLVKEALVDTRNRVNRWEYVTIASIMICMTVWDFVIGVLFGIIMSCVFFVVQNSQRRSIRALHTGESAMSTVRRPSAHRAYIRDVSKQTTILRLQGFLFFGTITHVEEAIRTLVEATALQRSPIRFLILDLALVAGVDMSAAEAFVRVQRLLLTHRIVLVFCGFNVNSPIGLALKSVELFEMGGVEIFSDFTEALEWTENAYLTAWFTSQKMESSAVGLPGRRQTVESFDISVSATPRRSHLLEAGFRTIGQDYPPPETQVQEEDREPFNTLVRAFSSYGLIDRITFRPLISLLEPLSLPTGHVLWTQGSPPDGLYIVETGILRATYDFAADHASPTYETMVPGTLAGELSALSGLERNATCVVERDAKVWKLSVESLHRLQVEEPELAREFVQLVLKSAKLDYDILISALASRR